VLASVAPSDKLADLLHQRWLIDSSFAPLAASILRHLYRIDESNLKLSSFCLTHLLSDYRARIAIRSEDSNMFRNNVRALLEMFPVYREIDALISQSLVRPMFTSLDQLMDQQSDEKDISTVAELLVRHGAVLWKLSKADCDSIIMRIRHALCNMDLSASTRRLILQANDLWMNGWNLENIPECILNFYANNNDELQQTGENYERAVTEKSDNGHRNKLSVNQTEAETVI
ncbi:hypothetical protein AB6A40_008944, partial [Gnathostoma spinigerum]